MRTKLRRFLGVGLTAAFVAALVPAAAPVAAAPHGCSGSGASTGGRAEAREVLKEGLSARSSSSETFSFKTLHIEVKVPKKKYRIGQTVKLPIEVTRPAEEDPAGMGIPTPRPYVMPAEDVNVGVGLIINDVFLPGFAITDEDGKATLAIRIERWARPGKVNASFYAWKVIAEPPCFRFEEYGFKPIPGVFRVTR